MAELDLHTDDGVAIERLDDLVVAGWTGRDAASVEHHIHELEALGVAPPSTVPLYYRVSADLLNSATRIDVVGDATSGEVEPMIVCRHGKLWLGLASDHTDRALEAHSVALSKQVCAKPCARELWSFDELSERLDSLELRSWVPAENSKDFAAVSENDRGRQPDSIDWQPYQEGCLAHLRPLRELLAGSPLSDPSGQGSSATAAMLCGTLPAIGGVRPASAFRIELHDPASGRSLRHAYAIRTLPVID